MKMKPWFAIDWKERLTDLRVMEVEGDGVKMVFIRERKNVQTHHVMCPDPELLPWLQETATDAARVAAQREKVVTLKFHDE